MIQEKTTFFLHYTNFFFSSKEIHPSIHPSPTPLCRKNRLHNSHFVVPFHLDSRFRTHTASIVSFTCNSHSTPRAYTCRSTCKSIYIDTVLPRVSHFYRGEMNDTEKAPI